LALSNLGGNSVTVLLGSPGGTFQAHVECATGTARVAEMFDSFAGIK
jgi:hypothetical protein